VKKILITNSTCLQDNIGGASRAIHETLLELSKKHHVTLLVPNRNNKKQFEKINENYVIVRYPYDSKNKVSKLFSSIKFFLKGNEYIKKQYDVFWGQSPEPYLYLVLFTKLNKIKNKIYTFHGPWYEEYMFASGKRNIFLKYMINFIEKIIIKYSDTIHFQSNFIKEKILENHKSLESKKTKVLNILINPTQYQNKIYPSIEKLVKNEKLNLFIIRRLTPRTGVLNFIKNINLLDDDIKCKLNINIAGQGTEFKEIELYIKDNKMCDFITLLGEITQEKADILIHKSHYVVMPSLAAEGFGVTVLEALYQETEVLYANNGGMKEFLSDTYPNNKFDPMNFESIKSILHQKLEIIKSNDFNKIFREVDSNLNFQNNLKELLEFDYEK